MEGDIKELARFLGVSLADAKARVKTYAESEMASEWERSPHTTAEEVKEYYKKTDKYLYDLIRWNHTKQFHDKIANLLHYRSCKILEIGAGIGSLCIALAMNGNDVTYYDISPKLTAFAKQRFSDRLLDVKIVPTLKGLKDFDIVVAIDVIEHIHIDDLPQMVKDIAGCLKDEGFLYNRSNWGQQHIFPMHYDNEHEFARLANEAGLNKRDNGDWVKGTNTAGVQIGIPSATGSTKLAVTRTLLDLEAPHGTTLTTCEKYPVDIARNKIVKQLTKDWLFFMDSDQLFPPQALSRLMSWNQPIVSGLIFMRTGPPVPMIYKYAFETGKGHYYKSMQLEVGEYLEKNAHILDGKKAAVVGPPYALIECDGISMGCCLIHRIVFDAMEEPYFQCDPGMKAGEDFYFCRKAQEAGFPIYADPSVICAHYTEYLRSYKHFKQFVKKEPFDWSEEC